MGGEGEAQGDAIPQLSVVGRQPNEVRNLDPALRMPTEGSWRHCIEWQAPGGREGEAAGIAALKGSRRYDGMDADSKCSKRR